MQFFSFLIETAVHFPESHILPTHLTPRLLAKSTVLFSYISFCYGGNCN
jgi:hypothetical protein